MGRTPPVRSASGNLHSTGNGPCRVRHASQLTEVDGRWYDRGAAFAEPVEEKRHEQSTPPRARSAFGSRLGRAGQAPHHPSQGGKSTAIGLPVYSHAPWSPTAAAASRASAGASRSFGRLRPCSLSLVRQFRWRSLPRPPRLRSRLRPAPLRPRRTIEAPRQATEVPRQTEAPGRAAPARHSPRRRRRLQRQLNPSPRPEHRRPRPRSPRHRAAARLPRPLNPRALRPNGRRRHRPARLELFRSARS